MAWFKNSRASASPLRRDRGGDIAPMFAIALLPLMTSVGAAVDYGRYVTAEGMLQHASDSAALVISKEIESGASPADVAGRLREIVASQLRDNRLSTWESSYSYDPETYKVVVNTTGELPTTFMGIAGIETMTVGVEAVAVNGTDFVEIAMVLDNTGSMASSGKLTQLKIAAKTVIEQLAETPSGKAGKTSVSIVPFGVPVRLGVAHDGAPWLGPAQTKTVCSGRGAKRTCTTVPLDWLGCVGDRVSPFTVTNDAAMAGASLYPRHYGTCALSPLLPLTSDLAKAAGAIDTMIASGYTNIPVGLMWGWNMLTPGAPASQALVSKPEKRVNRYLILLSDGDNTQNTLGSQASKIDEFTKDMCVNVGKTDIVVFTIRVIDGNESLLKGCASSPAYYYDVNDSKMLTGVFQQIMANISRLRLAA